MNKIDKPLVRLIRKRSTHTQIESKIRTEKSLQTTQRYKSFL